MSFVRERYGAYKNFEALIRAKNLRTFLATSVGVIDNSWEIFCLSKKILVDLLTELPLLRVINLSNFEISEVPESIGSLRHLRYVKLPDNFLKLRKLRHLDIRHKPILKKIPFENMVIEEPTNALQNHYWK